MVVAWACAPDAKYVNGGAHDVTSDANSANRGANPAMAALIQEKNNPKNQKRLPMNDTEANGADTGWLRSLFRQNGEVGIGSLVFVLF